MYFKTCELHSANGSATNFLLWLVLYRTRIAYKNIRYLLVHYVKVSYGISYIHVAWMEKRLFILLTDGYIRWKLLSFCFTSFCQRFSFQYFFFFFFHSSILLQCIIFIIVIIETQWSYNRLCQFISFLMENFRIIELCVYNTKENSRLVRSHHIHVLQTFLACHCV